MKEEKENGRKYQRGQREEEESQIEGKGKKETTDRWQSLFWFPDHLFARAQKEKKKKKDEKVRKKKESRKVKW